MPAILGELFWAPFIFIYTIKFSSVEDKIGIDPLFALYFTISLAV